MTLKNKLNITHQVELAKAEEKIRKQKAKQCVHFMLNRFL